jgi:hypothetical protein
VVRESAKEVTVACRMMFLLAALRLNLLADLEKYKTNLVLVL